MFEEISTHKDIKSRSDALKKTLASSDTDFNKLLDFIDAEFESEFPVPYLKFLIKTRIWIFKSKKIKPLKFNEVLFLESLQLCQSSEVRELIRAYAPHFSPSHHKLETWLEKNSLSSNSELRAISRKALDYFQKQKGKVTQIAPNSEEGRQKSNESTSMERDQQRPITISSFKLLDRDAKLDFINDLVAKKEEPPEMMTALLLCEADKFVLSKLLKELPSMLIALESFCQHSLLHVILSFSKHNDPRVRANSIEGIKVFLKNNLYVHEIAKEVLPLVRDVDQRVKTQALEILGAIGNDEVYGLLKLAIEKASNEEEVASFRWLIANLPETSVNDLTAVLDSREAEIVSKLSNSDGLIPQMEIASSDLETNVEESSKQEVRSEDSDKVDSLSRSHENLNLDASMVKEIPELKLKSGRKKGKQSKITSAGSFKMKWKLNAVFFGGGLIAISVAGIYLYLSYYLPWREREYKLSLESLLRFDGTSLEDLKGRSNAVKLAFQNLSEQQKESMKDSYSLDNASRVFKEKLDKLKLESKVRTIEDHYELLTDAIHANDLKAFELSWKILSQEIDSVPSQVLSTDILGSRTQEFYTSIHKQIKLANQQNEILDLERAFLKTKNKFYDLLSGQNLAGANAEIKLLRELNLELSNMPKKFVKINFSVQKLNRAFESFKAKKEFVDLLDGDIVNLDRILKDGLLSKRKLGSILQESLITIDNKVFLKLWAALGKNSESVDQKLLGAREYSGIFDFIDTSSEFTIRRSNEKLDSVLSQIKRGYKSQFFLITDKVEIKPFDFNKRIIESTELSRVNLEYDISGYAISRTKLLNILGSRIRKRIDGIWAVIDFTDFNLKSNEIDANIAEDLFKGFTKEASSWDREIARAFGTAVRLKTYGKVFLIGKPLIAIDKKSGFIFGQGYKQKTLTFDVFVALLVDDKFQLHVIETFKKLDSD